MNIQELLKSDQIILKHIRGSHMYGTNIETSDIDTGGIFVIPNADWLSLIHAPKEIGDEKGDEKYFELRKYMELACTANPTVLETMFAPEECITYIKPQGEYLMKHAEMFITKKCYWSFSGYAYAQIKKAKGKNKKVHNVDTYMNEQGVLLVREALKNGEITEAWIQSRFNKHFLKYIMKMVYSKLTDDTDWKLMDKILDEDCVRFMLGPQREEFCYVVIDDFQMSKFTERSMEMLKDKIMPFRSHTKEDLTKFDISKVEHMANLYRLYDNGRGVFKNNQLVLTSISKDREWEDFHGIMYFNEQEYEKQHKEWRSFWEWMSNRNDNRWEDNQGKNFTYDHKNMMHTVRLLMEAENIVKNGRPVIRFTGDNLKYLKSIRSGEFEYEYLLKWAEDKCEELKEIYDNSSLPYQVNMKKAEKLYKELVLNYK